MGQVQFCCWLAWQGGVGWRVTERNHSWCFLPGIV